MLSALTAALCASNKPNFLEAATASVLLMTLSGEKAYKKVVKMDGGHGLFSAYLIDEIGKAKDRDFAEGIKIELR